MIVSRCIIYYWYVGEKLKKYLLSTANSYCEASLPRNINCCHHQPSLTSHLLPSAKVKHWQFFFVILFCIRNLFFLFYLLLFFRQVNDSQYIVLLSLCTHQLIAWDIPNHSNCYRCFYHSIAQPLPCNYNIHH